ncbi:RusA family crossover junction endodeoxyribonuclease [Candidatus Poriferisodalis sp.]|uniref:RusA family crossover junction endodeoxyribonuclease n=1 Tax=Candidatus Poriferisodalis sp. TaxID=3101277 RepID=UPI003B01DE77
MSLPLEFIVDGSPVSQQAKKASRRRAWQARVSQAASAPWSSPSAIAGDVAVTINYFCSDPWADRRESLDVDNVPKPILDALKGLVYIDDKQVIDVECHRRNLHDDLRWDGATAVLHPHVTRTTPFLHVLVAAADARELFAR